MCAYCSRFALKYKILWFRVAFRVDKDLAVKELNTENYFSCPAREVENSRMLDGESVCAE